uniref:Uncharacterized protein n=1 Tax=Ananas comosus var. bracteatus TaxID=296719 RepID=A0A6V7Q9M7_ANACO|nr:unnamed protein product [Ananas comosus var. bracteatus]
MSSGSIEDERRVGEIQRECSGCSYSVQKRKRRDGFMVKTRSDASVAESQQSIPDPQQSVSERVADSRDPVPGRVPDSQQYIVGLLYLIIYTLLPLHLDLRSF